MPANSQRGNVAILLLFVVVLVAAGTGAYLYGKGSLKLPAKTSQDATSSSHSAPTQTSDEMTNWKTYSNTQMGFSFKYPESYTVDVYDEGKLLFIHDKNLKCDELSKCLIFNGQLVGTMKDYDKYVADTKDYVTKTTDNLVTETGPYDLNSEVKNVFGGSKVWRYKNGAIDMRYSNVTNKIAEEYKQIISTFKFTQ